MLIDPIRTYAPAFNLRVARGTGGFRYREAQLTGMGREREVRLPAFGYPMVHGFRVCFTMPPPTSSTLNDMSRHAP
jgi:hypothetical protein